MMTLNLSTITDALKNQSFAYGRTDDLFDVALISSSDWNQFSRSWEYLKEDQYMGDGGKYRLRRYSEFGIETGKWELSILPHKPYRQSKLVNYLNGDIDRYYSPIQSEIYNNKIFKGVVLSCADILHGIHPNSTWFAQIFQNRILARSGELGKPTPEGIHRDGVDYVLTLMVNRYNVTGGESSVYNTSTKTPLTTVSFEDLGEFIFLDDNKTMHGVQPVACVNQNEIGYRDVLIVMYTQNK